MQAKPGQNRKAMKATQQLAKKALGGLSFPTATSLTQTQSVRFGHPSQSHVPNIQNYNTGGPLTSSTAQSGMSSTTAPNAHLLHYEHGQAPPMGNTATIPLIGKGQNSYNN